MSTRVFFRSLIIMALAGLVAVGCIARGDTMPNEVIDSYEQALERFAGDPGGIEIGLERFRQSYADLTSEQVGQRMAELYADEIFFNDTLHTFGTRDELVDYMSRTGASLSESRIEVRQVMSDGADVFVRWTMTFHTSALGREIHSQSIGMTHLRFNADGQVLLHQDFWDSGHALYAHLPFVGFAVRRARDRM